MSSNSRIGLQTGHHARPSVLSSSNLSTGPISINKALFLTNSPVIPKKPKWYQGWGVLIIVSLLNVFGFFLNHGPALAVLSIPVLLFLNEGFKQNNPDQEATRRCALEGFVKGAVLGPPVLALAETVGGVVLALICFGQTSFENIVNSATQSPNEQLSASFSTRLFREASIQDPWGAAAFALLSSMLVAGLSEEAFKMGIGAWQVFRFRAHKRTLDPIVVLGAVGLGLAYAESIVAVSGMRGLPAARLAAERVITCFPIHIACAILSAKRAKVLESWVGAVMPSALVHGAFDFGIIMCSNFLTRYASLGWSFSAAAATSLAVNST